MASVSRWSPHGSWISLHSKALASEDIHRLSCNMAIHNLRRGYSQSLTLLRYASIGKYPTCQPSLRIFSMPVSLEDKPSSSSPEDESSINEFDPKDSSQKVLPQKLANEELMSLLTDSERSKLIRKLSEANQHNRFLKRQLQIKEDALLNFKSELAVMEFEIQALVTLAEEIAKTGIQPGSRKINGKYIHSHLISRLEAVHNKLKEQIKDVDVVQSKEVRLHWHGMAESVQVMGTFDGWSQGESLSPEYTDGEWRLSPELPTIGEGMLENNLLIEPSLSNQNHGIELSNQSAGRSGNESGNGSVGAAD
ncbi:hypothetical protein BVC80_9071g36 [Macleaya cordata]|uniref:AMP-activated protein kinase glycogen-binding domain-containing protein n=1 Tax=Macleaya cordata TaxID=56857 RepID=A0A200PU25_MACCD|nr:hypothetical protein BVC80_9071g36 [Macleaya cordata]